MPNKTTVKDGIYTYYSGDMKGETMTVGSFKVQDGAISYFDKPSRSALKSMLPEGDIDISTDRRIHNLLNGGHHHDYIVLKDTP